MSANSKDGNRLTPRLQPGRFLSTNRAITMGRAPTATGVTFLHRRKLLIAAFIIVATATNRQMRFFSSHITTITPHLSIWLPFRTTTVIAWQQFVIGDHARPHFSSITAPYAFIFTPAIVPRFMRTVAAFMLAPIMVRAMLFFMTMAMLHIMVHVVFGVIVMAFRHLCHGYPLSTGMRGRVKKPRARRLRLRNS